MQLTELKNQFNTLRTDRIFLINCCIIFGTLLFSFIILISLWSRLPPAVPMYYSLPWGEEQLASPLSLLLLLISGLLVFVFNTLLVLVLQTTSSLYGRIVLFSSSGIILLLSITVIQIIFLVT